MRKRFHMIRIRRIKIGCARTVQAEEIEDRLMDPDWLLGDIDLLLTDLEKYVDGVRRIKEGVAGKDWKKLLKEMEGAALWVEQGAELHSKIFGAMRKRGPKQPPPAPSVAR